VCFGLAHVVNIWYSFAAGTAPSMTGLGFFLGAFFGKKTPARRFCQLPIIIHTQFSRL